jgi:hypothetical protein
MYSRSRDSLTGFDKAFTRFISNVHYPALYFLSMDVLFYSSHNLLHQDMDSQIQTRDSVFSYMLSLYLLSVLVYQVVQMYCASRDWVKIDMDTVIEESFVKQIAIMKAMDPYMDHLDAVEKVQNTKIELVNDDIKRRSGQAKAGFDESLRFVRDGVIGDGRGRGVWARYYHICGLFKTLFMEVALVSLQMLPMVQMASLLLIEVLYILVAVMAGKFLEDKLSWSATLFSEAGILTVLVISQYIMIQNDTQSQLRQREFPDSPGELQFWAAICVIVVSSVALIYGIVTAVSESKKKLLPSQILPYIERLSSEQEFQKILKTKYPKYENIDINEDEEDMRNGRFTRSRVAAKTFKPPSALIIGQPNIKGGYMRVRRPTKGLGTSPFSSPTMQKQKEFKEAKIMNKLAKLNAMAVPKIELKPNSFDASKRSVQTGLEPESPAVVNPTTPMSPTKDSGRNHLGSALFPPPSGTMTPIIPSTPTISDFNLRIAVENSQGSYRATTPTLSPAHFRKRVMTLIKKN